MRQLQLQDGLQSHQVPAVRDSVSQGLSRMRILDGKETLEISHFRQIIITRASEPRQSWACGKPQQAGMFTAAGWASTYCEESDPICLV